MSRGSTAPISTPLTPVAFITLGLLAAVAPLSTDLYLPAFPLMTADFDTTAMGVQLSLTTFLVGAGLGQVIFGPWSDRHGRMQPLLIGLAVSVIASIVVAIAPNVTVLVIARLFQGIGGSAGMVIGRAMVLDRQTGTAAAKALNLMMAITGIAPIIAPMIGSLLIEPIGWRGLMWVLVGLAVLSLVAALLTLRETLPRAVRETHRKERTGHPFRALLNRGFIGGTFAFAFAMGVLMSYISASPFVYQNVLGMSEVAHGIAFGINAVGVTIATLLSSRLSNRFTLPQLSGAGLVLSLIGILVSFLAVAVGTDTSGGATLLLITLFLAGMPLGLVLGNVSVIAMSSVAAGSTGLASALLGLLQFGIAGAVAVIVGVGGADTAVPMLFTMLASAVLALIGWYVATRPAR